ncbi:MAG: hypothetical protein BGO25_15630 [Acidobacteriales bacterium 59-55]|nr:MAG: hypothetical protein BGO25_15630 [Acidobacteriales bacterium 59-55]
MFQVTARDVLSLTDEDLRTAIALTAEAEARRYGFASTSITWSGDQRANDGGVDVQAKLSSAPTLGMTIPRSFTAFQAKAEKMPVSKITKEMRPKGIVRAIFKELADARGAYVIISSKESLSKTALAERVKAMRAAVHDVPGQRDLHLDFFDSGALATWIRGYAGPSVWVLEKVGRRLSNWKPFAAWAYAKEGVEAPYLIDEQVRVHVPDTNPETDFDALVALEKIRARLAEDKASVRIVGLSGVGKTRFAQALFDARVGSNALDHTLAVYTDVGHDPDPEPNSLISDLIIAGTRAIVIVDNCRPAVHRKLSATVADRASKVSLVTIEYDVRDDEFEDTDVFELNAASESLVEQLLAQRFPALSHSDIHTIAKMAGGNLRIAIVIASSGGRSGSFASLKSDELMDRLFYQKNEVDPDLRRAGHVLSLPYSFSVENPELENSELAFLAELAETSVSRLYEHARILRDRDLIQQRGMFRALLPPGISNRLAQVGLERIPAERARDWLARIPFRLLKSVAHRLSFLDGIPEAEQIADEWLSPGGLVGSPDQLTEDLQQIFLYVAPLRPALASECLERAFMNMDDAQTARLCAPYIDFLQWLAHDARVFGPCVTLLIRVRAGTERKSDSKLLHDQFFHLFQAYLSGTHATVEQRIAILESLLLQPSRSARFAIGIAGLKSLLKSRDFTGSDWRFGTSSRDYGLWPQGEGFRHWFRMTLAFCERLDRRGGELGVQVRAAVAEELRDLWLCEAVYPELQSLAKSFSKRRFWPEGWIAANSIGRWRGDELTKSSQAALPRLVSALRPNTLEDRALTFAQRKMQTLYFEMQDYEEDYTAVERRVSDEGVKLGGELASDLETLRAVLPALLNREMFVPVHSLAAGLAGKLRNPASVWALLHCSYLELSEDERKPELLAVFLSSLQKKRATFVETALEKLSHDPEFAPDFPRIQCAVIPGPKGVARLIQSMKSDTVASSSYEAIANVSDCLTDKEFGKLFRPLAKRPGGFDACLHLIWLRLARMKTQPSKPTTGLKTLGRDLLLQWDCSPHGSMMDYQLAEVVEKCMPSLGSEKVAYELCTRCSKKAHMSLFFLDQYPRLFTALMKVHPEDTLSGLLDSGSKLQRRGSARRRNHESGSLFAALPEKAVIDWCEKGKPGRYVLMASVIDAISEGDKGDTAWQPLALAILAKARGKEKVLAAYFHQFRPMSWSGSRASIMERRLGLFDDLLLMPKLNRYYPYIQNEKANFLIDIERDRVLDKRLHGSGAATFE